ncbi:MAG: radical SAM protein [Acidaminobacteraceae bacterium]
MYSYPLYRPPSESRSLIVQITEGCSHNKCEFCYMYKDKKFRVKSDLEIERHIKELKSEYKNVERIFIADGDFLALNTERILSILEMVKLNFSEVKRISAYAGPLNILRKTTDQLQLINKNGLDFLYLGVESGSDNVLSLMNKGVTAMQMQSVGVKIKESSFTLSCMIISGLGGSEFTEEHALSSAKLISAIKPDYLSLLTLLIDEDTNLHKMLKEKKFFVLSASDVLKETLLFLENTNLENTIFRSNHPSNYLNLKGVLGRDKDKLISQVREHIDENSFKSEHYRLL